MAYWTGRGVPIDLVSAYKWIKLAQLTAQQPHQPTEWAKGGLVTPAVAGGTLQVIKSKMTEKQIDDAEALVASFHAQPW